MREIKFRAWDKINNKWHVWHHFEHTVDDINPRHIMVMGNKDTDLVYQQFTGLKDKNGKDEIYEGDIVNDVIDGLTYTSEVKWSESNSGFWVGGYFPLTKRCADNLEVIGNIYENPELLKN
jgi:hypothetical protein